MKNLIIVMSIFLSGLVCFGQYAKKGDVAAMKILPLNAKISNNGAKDVTIWKNKIIPFTATDHDGVSHSIQSYLDSGKTIIIDVFAAWCNPCYALHSSKILENIYKSVGQGGTKEFVVLMMEIESTNTWAQVQGSNLANTYGKASAGDFTNGGENPVPIIDKDLSMYIPGFEGYLPSVFFICPEGYVRNITDEISGASAATIVNLKNGCPNEGTAPEVDIKGMTDVRINEDVTFNTYVVDATDSVSYEWNVEGGNPASGTADTITTSFAANGTYNVSVTVKNPNGSAADVLSVNARDCNVAENIISTFPYSNNINQGLNACWIPIDADGDGQGWGLVSVDDYGNIALASYSYDNDTEVALHPDNWVISPKVQLQAGKAYSFSVNAYGPDSDFCSEKFGIFVSTTSTETTDFTQIGSTITTTATSKTYTFDLSAYAGQTIYIAIRHFNVSDMYALFVDDIKISEAVSVEESAMNNFSIYPNPANDVLTVLNAEGQNVVVMNLLGEVLVNIEKAESNQIIDLSTFANGCYFVKIDKKIAKFSVVK